MVNFTTRGTFANLDRRIEYFEKGAEKQNFGDYLPELFSKELLTYPKVDADIFRLVGSVIADKWIRWDLSRVNGGVSGIIAFWLCGARTDLGLSEATKSHCLFFGVRGPRTRDLLGLPKDTVLGDPGLLAPILHRPSPHPNTAGKAICIPHIEDPLDDGALLALSGADVIIHPEIESSEEALREILNKIAGAKFVLTGSLHGAIIACAYDVPFAFWNTGHIDAPFKWDDFAQSVGIDCEFVQNLDQGKALWQATLSQQMKRPPLTPMLDICPYAIRPEKLIAALVADGRLDPGLGAAVGDVLSELPGATLDVARHHLSVSAGIGDRRKSMVDIGLQKSGLAIRKMGRAISPRFLRILLRRLRLAGG